MKVTKDQPKYLQGYSFHLSLFYVCLFLLRFVLVINVVDIIQGYYLIFKLSMDFCVFAISRLKGCNFFSLLDFLCITNLIEKMKEEGNKEQQRKATTMVIIVPQETLL
jgi:hypothetical protein